VGQAAGDDWGARGDGVHRAKLKRLRIYRS
jgi:hypothetical protein